MKYLIHACPQRMWYVNRYLVPSMLDQGIDISSIQIFNDADRLGNLKATIKSFSQIPDNDDSTWHLQDDVVISAKFKEVTEKYREEVVCGFCSRYSGSKPSGLVNVANIWYSFPCIHIPNHIAARFVKWFNEEASLNKKYSKQLERNKYDDDFFKDFIRTKCKNIKLINLDPNIVNHVDYLIGGSVTNNRKQLAVSLYWKEELIIKDLESRLRADTRERYVMPPAKVAPKKPPFFSVIIPAHNAGKTIHKTLDSIMQQSFKDYETIVVCDACDDNTVQVVKKYKGVRYIEVNNHTDGLTRNDGLDIANGEWVLFIDADDWWLHQYVFDQIHGKILKNKDIDVLVFSMVWRHIGVVGARSAKGTLYPHCTNKCWRRSKIGDTKFPDKKVANDAGFHERMMAKNPKLLEWNMPMYYYDYLAPDSKSVSLGRSAEKTKQYWSTH